MIGWLILRYIWDKFAYKEMGDVQSIPKYKYLVKVQFRGPELFKKNGALFQEEAYLVNLCLYEQVGDTIVDGWPQFECNFNVFTDMILPYGSHCIDIIASPRTYQRWYQHVVVML